jgi:hypothetical protein
MIEMIGESAAQSRDDVDKRHSIALEFFFKCSS